MPSVTDDDILRVRLPDAQDVIMSKAFHSYDMAEKYREMESRSGIDFSATIALIQQLPIFMDGPQHKATRKKMAIHIASTKQQQEEVARKTLDSLLQKYFTRSCQLDLLTDFAMPLWHAVSKVISKREGKAQEVIDAIPSLFSPVLSIRKRKVINDMLAEIVVTEDADKLLLVALASLGVKPLTGSMALSLYDAALEHETGIVSAFELGDGYRKSSLTYVDRISNADITIGSCHYASGQRVRCVTQSNEYTQEESLASLYGFGAHVCLGRPLSQFIFDHLKRELRSYDCRMIPHRLEMDKNTNPFTYPVRAIVRIEV